MIFLYFYWDHTLLLEVDDEKLIEIHNHGLAGMEYKASHPQDAIVRDVATPSWPLPDWVPQPQDAKDWDPTSTDWQSGHVFYWTPRGADPATLWYHPSQPSQQAQFRKYISNNWSVIMVDNALNKMKASLDKAFSRIPIR